MAQETSYLLFKLFFGSPLIAGLLWRIDMNTCGGDRGGQLVRDSNVCGEVRCEGEREPG